MFVLKFLLPALGTLLLTSGAVLAANGAEQASSFTIEVANISTNKTLKLPDGSTKAVPVAPGAYAVVTKAGTIFEQGWQAPKNGLESLAEDGEPDSLIAALQKTKGVREAGLIIPGQPLTVKAKPGDRFVFAEMFVESNDLFFGPDSSGIVLFDLSGHPISGDLTSQIRLWDAGTEVNEAPGVGPNQAPRQKAPHTGIAEHGNVNPVADNFTYPLVSQVLKVTINGK